MALRIYEPRGNEGCSSLQTIPLPRSISGLESELASSVTKQAGLEKQPQRPPAEVRPISPSITQPDITTRRVKAPDRSLLSGLVMLGQDGKNPILNKPERCFPPLPRGPITRLGHQNCHDWVKTKAEKKNPAFQAKEKQVIKPWERRVGRRVTRKSLWAEQGESQGESGSG